MYISQGAEPRATKPTQKASQRNLDFGLLLYEPRIDGTCPTLDADIAGVGIIISFIISSVGTVAVSIAAQVLIYLRDIERLSSKPTPMYNIYIKYLRRLVMALGDQQLITAFGVLISAWVRPVIDLRGAHFRLAVEICLLFMATFASTAPIYAPTCRRDFRTALKPNLFNLLQALVWSSGLFALTIFGFVVYITWLAIFAHSIGRPFFLSSFYLVIALLGPLTVAGYLTSTAIIREHGNGLGAMSSVFWSLLEAGICSGVILYYPRLYASVTNFIASSSWLISFKRVLFGVKGDNENEARVLQMRNDQNSALRTRTLTRVLFYMVAEAAAIALVMHQRFGPVKSSKSDQSCAMRDFIKDEWGSGQTLAVLLLCLPLLDLCQALYDARTEMIEIRIKPTETIGINYRDEELQRPDIEPSRNNYANFHRDEEMTESLIPGRSRSDVIEAGATTGRTFSIVRSEFPNGIKTIPTDGGNLQCGLRAVIHTLAAMHPDLPQPTLQELLDVLYSQEFQEIQSQFGLSNHNNFHVDQISAIVHFWGNKFHDLPLQIGAIVQDGDTFLVPYNGPQTPTIIWIHNAPVENSSKAGGGALRHFSGVMPNFPTPVREPARAETHQKDKSHSEKPQRSGHPQNSSTGERSTEAVQRTAPASVTQHGDSESENRSNLDEGFASIPLQELI